MFTSLIMPLAAVLLLSTGAAFAEPANDVKTETEAKAPEVGGGSEQRPRPMLENMDRDQNGSVNAAEAEEFSNEQFDLIDNNKDGFITAAEMDTFHHSQRGNRKMEHDKDMGQPSKLTPEMEAKMKARMEERRKEHFAEVDPDGDGKVTKAEFLNRAKERHKKMDSDGDGNITKEEIRKQHEERREKRKAMRDKREERRMEGGTSQPPAPEGKREDKPEAAPVE